jgi:nucleoside-diphosphate-sugar epimerase
VDLAGKRILVTGGAGAIGGNLIAALTERAGGITIVDDCSSGHVENIPASPRMVFHRDTILNEPLMAEILGGGIDVVFHLAANFANQNSVDHPRKDLDVNGKGTLQLLELARDNNVKRFIYTSSSCVYGNRDVALREDMTDYSLDTPYAITKLLGERYVTFFNQHYGLPTTILRFFNAYGPGEYPGRYRNVIPNFMLLALRGEPLPITGSGEETRDFTYVEDTITGTIALTESDRAAGEIFNIGSGRETRIVDLAEAINDIAGNSAGIQFKPPRNWDSVKVRRADVAKAGEIAGYAPRTSLREGLARLLEWFHARGIS